MDSEITTTIITITLTGTIQFLLWLNQKRVDKKKDAAELEKTAAETGNISSETIQNLITSIGELEKLHAESKDESKKLSDENEILCERLEKQSKQIDMLEDSYKVIVRQNEKLLQENEEMRKDILELTAENAALRKLITDEQIKKGKL